jgi:hypothetical protein
VTDQVSIRLYLDDRFNQIVITTAQTGNKDVTVKFTDSFALTRSVAQVTWY